MAGGICTLHHQFTMGCGILTQSDDKSEHVSLNSHKEFVRETKCSRKKRKQEVFKKFVKIKCNFQSQGKKDCFKKTCYVGMVL